MKKSPNITGGTSSICSSCGRDGHKFDAIIVKDGNHVRPLKYCIRCGEPNPQAPIHSGTRTRVSSDFLASPKGEAA